MKEAREMKAREGPRGGEMGTGSGGEEEMEVRGGREGDGREMGETVRGGDEERGGKWKREGGEEGMEERGRRRGDGRERGRVYDIVHTPL